MSCTLKIDHKLISLGSVNVFAAVRLREHKKLFPSARCEKMLMSSVSVSNCIKFYQTAEDIGAKDLQKYCAEIISNHWVGEGFFFNTVFRAFNNYFHIL